MYVYIELVIKLYNDYYLIETHTIKAIELSGGK